MKRYLVPVIALSLTGCATNKEVAQAVLEANARIASQPTLSINCPAGCSATYIDPRDRHAGIKLPTNGWDAVISVGNNLTGLAQSMVVPGAMGYVAVQGFKALQGSGAVSTVTTTNTNTSTTGPSNSNNTATTSTVGPNSGANSGSTTTSSTSSSSTSNTTTNSNNSTPTTTSTSNTTSTTNTSSNNTTPSTTSTTTTNTSSNNTTTTTTPPAP